MTEPPETIAIVGLGYVGLPLAVAFAAHRPVVGFAPASLTAPDESDPRP